MQVRTSLQTDNHTSTPPLSFLQAGCPSCRPTNSVKALKAYISIYMYIFWKSPGVLEICWAAFVDTRLHDCFFPAVSAFEATCRRAEQQMRGVASCCVTLYSVTMSNNTLSGLAKIQLLASQHRPSIVDVVLIQQRRQKEAPNAQQAISSYTTNRPVARS